MPLSIMGVNAPKSCAAGMRRMRVVPRKEMPFVPNLIGRRGFFRSLFRKALGALFEGAVAARMGGGVES